ncbi:hypothetical protein Isop_3245 [Isosphaera pallida ATCC 43644]|jgi:ABC-2 type transport system permease protein|uniref:DUF3526 domain-containing protein n=1 Tax=Isosphaera pallida (strain ATCC 43644 / DSM 9630 / IS1B) TaxID=575540 RepID=E8R554_ISOPI|nr:DUF3526 domain-containing protein [Isosphaera pallida]ADV63807.1 hypothetical protein Isop_3245 [Isosphaera pallida ATCC 43644]
MIASVSLQAFRIARKEFVDLVRDGRFVGSAVVLGVLLTTALLIGFVHWRTVAADHKRAMEQARMDFVCQEEKNPHAAAHYGMFVFKPRSPLSFVDRGVDAYTGVSFKLEAHHRNEPQHVPAKDSTTLQRFGELTASLVLQALVPLVIIFLGFSAFTSERERGTLRQLLSLGVRPLDLAAGKLLGIAAALGLVLVPVTLVGVGLISLGGDVELTPSRTRFVLLTLTYLGWFAVVLMVTLAVSARSRSSRAALLTLLGFWMLNVIAAPRLAADVAKRLAPTPSAFEFARQVERDLQGGIDGHNAADERLEKIKQELLDKYQVDDVEDLPVNFAGIALQEGENATNAILDKCYAELWQSFRDQDVVREALGLLFPALATRSLSMALAGTDNAHHEQFAEAAERYRRILVRDLNQLLIENAGDLGSAYTIGRKEYETIPHFHYRMPPAREVVERATLPIVGLAIWLALSGYALYASAQDLRPE